MAKTKQTEEFGDFQTPAELAAEACRLLEVEDSPSSIVEPTCGLGNFAVAAAQAFPQASEILGVEINSQYADEARSRLCADKRVRVQTASFFELDWTALIAPLTEPVLIVGNPPWVTNAALGSLGSENRPERSNFLGFSGFDALTGKSNFDVSEWMLIKLADALNGKRGQLAMLVKSAVARKLCHYVWKRQYQLRRAAIFGIDAKQWFGASVDACFVVLDFMPGGTSTEGEVYPGLSWNSMCNRIGLRDNEVVADIDCYERTKHLSGKGKPTRPWRSGLKHDCSAVMEFTLEDGVLRNGLGEEVEIESEYLFPWLKTSDVARGGWKIPRFVLVTQRKVGEDTSVIASRAPKTWDYLLKHSERLDKRGSSIYRNNPRFSIFGIGDYSFKPWKVAISGLYKKLSFCALGPVEGKPVMVDDASYFLSAESETEARELAAFLNGPNAKAFFAAHIFWDAKRPITAALLNRLDIEKLQGHSPKSKAPQLELEIA